MTIHGLSRIKNGFTKNAIGLFTGLLMIDSLFIGLHILFSTTGFSDDLNFRLSQENGYAEHFQYVKSALVTVLFIFLAWHYRAWLFLAWAVVFKYIFLDDTLAIHEHAGEYIDGFFGFATAFSLRPQDIGELVILAVSGLTLLLLVGFSYRWSQHSLARSVTPLMGGLVLLLGFFSMVVDVVHSLIGSISTSRALNITITILEEGSEHLILTAILTYVFMLVEEAVSVPEAVQRAPKTDLRLAND